MSTTSGRPIVRPTLQTVPESLPADHVTQNQAQAVAVVTSAPTPTVAAEKTLQSTPSTVPTTTTASLKPRSSSTRVSTLLNESSSTKFVLKLVKPTLRLKCGILVYCGLVNDESSIKLKCILLLTVALLWTWSAFPFLIMIIATDEWMARGWIKLLWCLISMTFRKAIRWHK